MKESRVSPLRGVVPWGRVDDAIAGTSARASLTVATGDADQSHEGEVW